MSHKQASELNDREEQRVKEHAKPPAPLVYEIIRRDGEEELSRSNTSLAWSGIAAGLLISLSVYAEASLRAHLPDAPWRPLIENFGYSVGFLVVIMGRMQLFTENTITTVVPTLLEPHRWNVIRTATLWSIVFGANLIGATLAALFFATTPVATPDIAQAFGEISAHIFEIAPSDVFGRGILAGVLIAAIVWMMPNAGASGFWVILFFTYLIALGDLAHVVAGSVEAAYVVITGGISASDALTAFILPALAGNIVGGTLIFTLVIYAQVKRDLKK